MSQTMFTHARIVLPDEVVEGTVVARDGRIFESLDGHVTSNQAEDLEGDFLIADRQAMQSKHAAVNKRAILELARRLGVRLASHDDATEAHVEEAIADGVSIAEFPTTGEAARAAATGLRCSWGHRTCCAASRTPGTSPRPTWRRAACGAKA
jgi:alpha-D-ribose 1-methylphosphonate 5-triphosphate diphosphatase PhnM